jgi:hypothetical protein
MKNSNHINAAFVKRVLAMKDILEVILKLYMLSYPLLKLDFCNKIFKAWPLMFGPSMTFEVQNGPQYTFQSQA